MGKTKRGWWNGPDKSDKNDKERKHFVYIGEGYTTKAQGGPGNKRAWKQPMPKWKYKQIKEKLKNDE